MIRVISYVAAFVLAGMPLFAADDAGKQADGGYGLLLWCVAVLLAVTSVFFVKGMIRNRRFAKDGPKRCRIPALLRLGTRGGDPIIHGTISVIDPRSARLSYDATPQIQAAVMKCNDLPVSVIALNVEIPALLSRVDADSVGLYFEAPLEKRDLSYLLAHSTEPPAPCKGHGDPPNVKDHIRRALEPARRISLDDLNAYRQACSTYFEQERRRSDGGT